jgi:thiol-disulfide isomerase/thioredoxin
MSGPGRRRAHAPHPVEGASLPRVALGRREWLAAAVLANLLPHARAQAAAVAGLTLVSPGSLPSEALFTAAYVDLDGRPARLERAARPLVVNFWARWCAPCRVEIPELAALHARRSGVDVLGLNIESDPAPVRDFARAYEITYPVLLTREGGLDLMRTLGNAKAGLPFTLWLDRQGRIVALRLGVLVREQLDAALRLL